MGVNKRKNLKVRKHAFDQGNKEERKSDLDRAKKKKESTFLTKGKKKVTKILTKNKKASFRIRIPKAMVRIKFEN